MMKLKSLFLMAVAIILSAQLSAETLKTTKKRQSPATEPVPTEVTAPAETVLQSTKSVEDPNATTVTDENRSRNVKFGFTSSRFGVGMDFRVAKWLTLGPVIGIAASLSNYLNYVGLSAGGRANIYLAGDAINSSFYFGPSVLGNLWTVTGGGSPFDGAFSNVTVGSTFGYHWVWESGFNLMLGLGATYSTGGSSYTSSSGQFQITSVNLGGFAPSAELSIGWAF